VNIQDNDGKTPLHYAYDKTVVRGLLEKGGDLTIKDEKGNTPMDYKKQRDTIRTLLSTGSSINAPPHDENDALLHRHPRRFTLTRPDSRK
jgi:ankyrin repeat protein